MKQKISYILGFLVVAASILVYVGCGRTDGSLPAVPASVIGSTK
jgi:hypothetical protein